MALKTVGDLIRYLSRFDPNLPVVKYELDRPVYSCFTFEGNSELRVKPANNFDRVLEDPFTDVYIDANTDDQGSFNAIIL
jgi:hypothetical protein